MIDASVDNTLDFSIYKTDNKNNKSLSVDIDFNSDIKKSEDYQHLICSFCEEQAV